MQCKNQSKKAKKKFKKWNIQTPQLWVEVVFLSQFKDKAPPVSSTCTTKGNSAALIFGNIWVSNLVQLETEGSLPPPVWGQEHLSIPTYSLFDEGKSVEFGVKLSVLCNKLWRRSCDSDRQQFFGKIAIYYFWQKFFGKKWLTLPCGVCMYSLIANSL